MTHPPESLGRQGDPLDLDTHLERVGHQGGRSPTLGTLRALREAHVTSIPVFGIQFAPGDAARLVTEPEPE